MARRHGVAEVVLAEAQTAAIGRHSCVADLGLLNVDLLDGGGARAQIMILVVMQMLELDTKVAALHHHARLPGQIEGLAAPRIKFAVALEALELFAALVGRHLFTQYEQQQQQQHGFV